MGMDPFEDFEMKPITDGLGFHKKQINLKQSVESGGLMNSISPSRPPEAPTVDFLNPELDFENKGLTLEDLMEALTSPKELADQVMRNVAMDEDTFDASSEIEITMPLSRTENRGIDETQEVLRDTTIEIPSIADISNIGRASERFDIESELDSGQVGARRGSSNSPLTHLRPSPICLSSLFLDGLVVLALAMIFLSSLLMVTKVSLMSVVGAASADLSIQISAAVLYIAVYQMYAIVSRTFFGRTLGEWTFDHQLGDSEQQESGWYPLLVVWRSLIILVTGIVTLPFLSFIFRKDLASIFSGLQLYKQRT